MSLVYAFIFDRIVDLVQLTWQYSSFDGWNLRICSVANYWLSLAVMVITGAAMGSFSVTQSTLVLLISPSALKARAMGVLAICIGLCPLGMLHLGWMAEHLGTPVAVAMSAR